MVTFRKLFPTVSKSTTWYPLHMATGLKKIQRLLRDIDCVVEVHDARIPISGRSSSFHQQVICERPHLLVLNKMDLIDINFKTDVDKKLLGSCDRILYTTAKKQKKVNIEQIVPMCQEIVRSKPKFNRADKPEMNLLIVGVPNVGKSSIINSLRTTICGKKEVMAVAPHAGVTKTVSNRLKISNDPPTYLYDTPGILEPNLSMSESALRLAACGLFKDAAVGEVLIADYILFWLNRRKLFHYSNILGISEPSDNIVEVLSKIAINQNFLYETKDMKTRSNALRLDQTRAANYFINLFRDGTLGTYLLDDDLLYRASDPGFRVAL